MNEAKVLIAEDDVIIAADIKKHLQKAGYDVITVRHGHMAVKAAREKKPDVALIDIILEGYMDGIEAAKIISKELKIPVIFLTALNDDETFLIARDSEPFAYITKPFRPEQIIETLNSALQSTNE
jgi:CheY-like chemotaxis protein